MSEIGADVDVRIEIDVEHVEDLIEQAEEREDVMIVIDEGFDITEDNLSLEEGYHLISMHSRDEYKNYVSIEKNVDGEWVKMVIEEITKLMNKFKTMVEALK